MTHPVIASVASAAKAYDAAELSDPDVVAKLTDAALDGATFGGYFAKSCTELNVLQHLMNLGLVDPDLATDFPAAVQARMASGVAFEEKVGAAWAAACSAAKLDAVFLTGDRSDASKDARAAATAQAMADGVQVIWNARLPRDTEAHTSLEPDALLRAGKRSDGRWAYHPVDVKDHAPTSGTTSTTLKVSTLGAPSVDDAFESAFTGNPVVADSLQLAAYARQLERMGHSPEDGDPVWGAIVGRAAGGADFTLTWRRLDAAMGPRTPQTPLAKYDAAFERNLQVVGRRVAAYAVPGLPRHEADHGPQMDTECKDCPMFKNVCRPDMEDSDHITLVPGITRARAGAHYGLGITSRAQLSRLDTATAIAVDAKVDVPASTAAASYLPAAIAKATPAVDVISGPKAKDLPTVGELLAAVGIRTAADVARLDAQTGAYTGTGVWNLTSSIDAARVAKAGKVHRARGVQEVRVDRAAIELDFDVEDIPVATLKSAGVDPHAGDAATALPGMEATSGTLVYMIGIKATGRRKRGGEERSRSEMNTFADYSGTFAGEREVFRAAWEYIQFMLTKARMNKWSIRAYHYTAHERHVFRTLATRHAGHKGIPTVEQVEEFFDSDACIDMHKVVTEQMVWPVADTTLKTIAGWARFSWADSDPSGGNSIAWVLQAITGPQDEQASWRERVEVYNADDVAAQLAIREFLTRLVTATDASAKLPGVETLERVYKGRPRR